MKIADQFHDELCRL
ncbi:protein YrbN, partial [Haemophilus parainfluenzae]